MAVKSIGLNGESQLLRDYLNETLANYSTLPEVSNFASEEVRARVLKRIGPVRN